MLGLGMVVALTMLDQQRGGTQLGGGGGGGGGLSGWGRGRAAEAAADRPGSMAAMREARLRSIGRRTTAASVD